MIRINGKFCLLLLLLSCFSCRDDVEIVEKAVAKNERISSDWPLWRGNRGQTGAVKIDADKDWHLRWDVKLGGDLTTAVAKDGRIYLAADKTIHCLSLADGGEIWRRDNEAVVDAPLVVNGNKLFFGDGKGFFQCWELSGGEELWSFDAGGKITGSANVSDDGSKVFFGSYDNKMRCLSVGGGALVWEYEADSYINGSPALADGKLSFGSCDGKLRILSIETGALLGDFDSESHVASSPAMDGDSVYSGNCAGAFFRLDAAGAERAWRYPAQGDVEGGFFASPALADGKIIAGAKSGRLICLDSASGEVVWCKELDGDIDAGPIIVGEFVAVAAGPRFLMFELAAGVKVWEFDLGADATGSPIFADGKLVIGAADGVLYAFGN